MKDKKQQSVSTLIKDYLRLTDEKVEIPLAIAATKEKISDALSKASGNSIKKVLQKIFLKAICTCENCRRGNWKSLRN